MNCLRCQSEMTYAGEKKFHEGTRWGALGDLAELFENREFLHLYVCECGYVEFRTRRE